MKKAFLLLFCLAQTPEAHATKYRVHVAKYETRVLMTAASNLSADLNRTPSLDEWPAILFTAPATESNWRGPYIKELPLDPWDRDYVYLPRLAGQNTFGFYSFGMNGIDEHGNNDDISSWAGYDEDIYFPDAKRNRYTALVFAFAFLFGIVYGSIAIVRWFRRRSNAAKHAAQDLSNRDSSRAR